MCPPKKSQPRPRFELLTPDRWNDLVKLFGSRGACGGCWCMWWRLKASEFEQRKGASNKKAFKRIVDRGDQPGLIGYVNDEPVGWCAIGPRECYPRLDHSRVLKPVDDQAVWSITCFFVEKAFRKQGMSIALLKAAVDFARSQGARIVEGYPIDSDEHYPEAFAYVGLVVSFRKAEFKEVARRSPNRPIMRKRL